MKKPKLIGSIDDVIAITGCELEDLEEVGEDHIEFGGAYEVSGTIILKMRPYFWDSEKKEWRKIG